MIRCSVVIPTYHRPASLARTLRALVAQTLSPDEYEVIVCDDAGSDETRRQVEQWSIDSGISAAYVRRERPRAGPATMRNAGWRTADGEIIAFTDDDTIPHPDWLRQGLVALADDAADAAAGRIVVPLPDEPTHYERDAARREGAGFVTANCFCRRSVLASIGGFDTRFRAAYREDSDLFFQLIRHGFDIVDAHDAVVVHPVRPEPWVVNLRKESRHIYDALLYKKHPELYAQFIRPDRPYLYYAILLALGIAVAGAMVDSKSLVSLGVVGWGALTGLLVARRLQQTRRSIDHVLEVVVTSLMIPFLSVYWRVRGGLAFRVAFW